MFEPSDETSWAHETFGNAKLGDARRSRRLVKMAATVARQPAGTVTQAIPAPAEREAAYRLLENDSAPPRELLRAVGDATARRCVDHDWVYIAVDQTTLSFIDRKNIRGLGRIADGSYDNRRGLEVINGLAIDAEGATVGVSAMRWSARPDGSTAGRKLEERESQMWRDVLADTTAHFEEHAPDTTLWFQLDAGADHAHNFLTAIELGHHITIRCANNRLIDTPQGKGKLFDEVDAQRVLGREVLECKGQSGQKRQAQLEIRACPVTVLMPTGGRKREPCGMWIVQVREVSEVPEGDEPILWNLLTTYQVDDFDDAREVITGYSLRWRIEDFYRTWKQGHCRLEDSQLRSRGAVLRWAILLAAVAARIERIKHRSRNEPDAPASSEFSREEIDAAILLSETKKWEPGAEPMLGEFVALVAQLGGYTGKSSGGPPGSVTIARGMDSVTLGATILLKARSRSGQ